MRPPLAWSSSHIAREETRIFLWMTRAESARFEPGTHAWFARQPGALPMCHAPSLQYSDHLWIAFYGANQQCVMIIGGDEDRRQIDRRIIKLIDTLLLSGSLCEATCRRGGGDKRGRRSIRVSQAGPTPRRPASATEKWKKTRRLIDCGRRGFCWRLDKTRVMDKWNYTLLNQGCSQAGPQFVTLAQLENSTGWSCVVFRATVRLTVPAPARWLSVLHPPQTGKSISSVQDWASLISTGSLRSAPLLRNLIRRLLISATWPV